LAANVSCWCRMNAALAATNAACSWTLPPALPTAGRRGGLPHPTGAS